MPIGTVYGYVRDAITGKLIHPCKIIITSAISTTNWENFPDGNYIINLLRGEGYKFEFKASGYHDVTIDNINVQSNGFHHHDAIMEPNPNLVKSSRRRPTIEEEKERMRQAMINRTPRTDLAEIKARQAGMQRKPTTIGGTVQIRRTAVAGPKAISRRRPQPQRGRAIRVKSGSRPIETRQNTTISTTQKIKEDKKKSTIKNTR